MEREPSKSWEAAAYDREKQEWVHTELHSYEHRPEIEQQDFINQAAPTKITPSRRVKPQRRDETAVIFPDAQIPFHDEKALQAAHGVVRELQPDRVVLLGDMADLPGQSRFEVHPSHLGRIQEQLDAIHTMLAQIRADAPDAQIDYIPGNHEKRLNKEIINKNAELLGIKRANAEKELGVLTLDFLLRTGELEVNMAAEYPNGEVWLNDETVAIHGDIARQNTSTSLEYLKKNPHLNTIHGHTHRAEIQWRTSRVRGGGMERWAMSPGTLSDIHGSVPSYGSSIGTEAHPEDRIENWQNGVGIVEYNKNMSNPELAIIRNGILRLRGIEYKY